MENAIINIQSMKDNVDWQKKYRKILSLTINTV
jgi:hypothetical protein